MLCEGLIDVGSIKFMYLGWRNPKPGQGMCGMHCYVLRLPIECWTSMLVQPSKRLYNLAYVDWCFDVVHWRSGSWSVIVQLYYRDLYQQESYFLGKDSLSTGDVPLTDRALWCLRELVRDTLLPPFKASALPDERAQALSQHIELQVHYIRKHVVDYLSYVDKLDKRTEAAWPY
jgi:hypothetical protein